MQGNKKLSREEQNEIMRLANIIYFRSQVYERTEWMGVKTAKCPMDMWVYQELIHKIKPDLLIETGTLFGGSALYFAQLFDMMDHGKVITVDLQPQENLPQHSRIDYLVGSSIDPVILDTIQQAVSNSERVMVILDSDHKAEYKLKELNAYAGFVSKESYMIAEDTCFDAFPAWPEYGPGPLKAVGDFIQINKEFELDRSQEKHMITFSPMAFLKRK